MVGVYDHGQQRSALVNGVFDLSIDLTNLAKAVERRTGKLSEAAQIDPSELVEVLDEVHTQAWAEKPLPIVTGQLNGSLTDPGHEDHVARVVDGAVEIGSRAPHAGKVIEDQNLAPDPQRLAVAQAEAVARHLKDNGYL